jgi:hypothetical protein
MSVSIHRLWDLHEDSFMPRWWFLFGTGSIVTCFITLCRGGLLFAQTSLALLHVQAIQSRSNFHGLRPGLNTRQSLIFSTTPHPSLCNEIWCNTYTKLPPLPKYLSCYPAAHDEDITGSHRFYHFWMTALLSIRWNTNGRTSSWLVRPISGFMVSTVYTMQD